LKSDKKLQSFYTSFMKYIFPFKIFLISSFILLCIKTTYAQSRSGIGIDYGANKPLSSDYNFGSGIQLFGDVAIGSKWAITPDMGYDRLNSTGRIYYDAKNLNNRRIGSVDLFHLGLSGKYCFSREWFAKAGAMLYAGSGNEDIAGAGISGMGTVGYNLELDEHSNFELSFNTTFVDIQSGDNGVTPIAGLKVAYLFDFRSAK
jgi:hypothetical protein